MDYEEMVSDFLDYWYDTVDTGTTTDSFVAYFLPDYVANI